jgi:hypothetical protein
MFCLRWLHNGKDYGMVSGEGIFVEGTPPHVEKVYPIQHSTHFSPKLTQLSCEGISKHGENVLCRILPKPLGRTVDHHTIFAKNTLSRGAVSFKRVKHQNKVTVKQEFTLFTMPFRTFIPI